MKSDTCNKSICQIRISYTTSHRFFPERIIMMLKCFSQTLQNPSDKTKLWRKIHVICTMLDLETRYHEFNFQDNYYY
jgi:hypothetical protein